MENYNVYASGSYLYFIRKDVFNYFLFSLDERALLLSDFAVTVNKNQRTVKVIKDRSGGLHKDTWIDGKPVMAYIEEYDKAQRQGRV